MMAVRFRLEALDDNCPELTRSVEYRLSRLVETESALSHHSKHGRGGLSRLRSRRPAPTSLYCVDLLRLRPHGAPQAELAKKLALNELVEVLAAWFLRNLNENLQVHLGWVAADASRRPVAGGEECAAGFVSS